MRLSAEAFPSVILPCISTSAAKIEPNSARIPPVVIIDALVPSAARADVTEIALVVVP